MKTEELLRHSSAYGKTVVCNAKKNRAENKI